MVVFGQGAVVIAVFNYLKTCHKEEGEQLTSFATEGRTCNNGFATKRDLNLNVKKSFLTLSSERTMGLTV